MKVFAILAAATVALVSAQAPDCDPSLVEAVRGTSGATCTSETGYSPVTFTVPTGDELVKVCSNPSCKALLAAVNKAVPTECSFAGKLVKATLLDPLTKACAGVASSPAAAPAANATTPAATTKAPAKETKSAAGSGAGEEVKVPETAAPTKAASNASNATTSTPAPTKSSASAIATAAGAVVVAVAASML